MNLREAEVCQVIGDPALEGLLFGSVNTTGVEPPVPLLAFRSVTSFTSPELLSPITDFMSLTSFVNPLLSLPIALAFASICATCSAVAPFIIGFPL